MCSSCCSRDTPSCARAYEVHEHTLLIPALIARFYAPGQSAAAGLDEAAASALLLAHGPNVLTAPPPHSALSRWLRQARDPLLLLLLFAAVLSFVSFGLTLSTSDVVLAAALIVVVLVAATIAFSAEAAAARVIDSVRSLCPPQCVVVRGGVARAVPSAALVPGDCVQLRLGNRKFRCEPPLAHQKPRPEKANP